MLSSLGFLLRPKMALIRIHGWTRARDKMFDTRNSFPWLLIKTPPWDLGTVKCHPGFAANSPCSTDPCTVQRWSTPVSGHWFDHLRVHKTALAAGE